MPPKRKIQKTEETADIVEVTSNKATVNKKGAKAVAESSSRTLRPRPKTTPIEQAKRKVEAKSIKTSKKEANGVESAPKPKRGGKKKVQESDDGEPAQKQRKQDIIEKEDDDVLNATSIYDFTANDIKGQIVALDKYKGHVCIIVNVASKCGHTASNYKELVEIYDKYSEDKGLRILAFPCNQFGKQEPGDNEKILDFAKKRNVNFDMFEKIEVNGKNAHPLWKYLTSQKQGPKGNRIDWNFTKFLINKDGEVVERFKSAVKPSALVKDLEKLW